MAQLRQNFDAEKSKLIDELTNETIGLLESSERVRVDWERQLRVAEAKLLKERADHANEIDVVVNEARRQQHELTARIKASFEIDMAKYESERCDHEMRLHEALDRATNAELSLADLKAENRIMDEKVY